MKHATYKYYPKKGKITEVRYCLGIECTYDEKNLDEGKIFIKIQIDTCICAGCENWRGTKKKKEEIEKHLEDLNKRLIDAEEDRKACNGKFIQDCEMEK